MVKMKNLHDFSAPYKFKWRAFRARAVKFKQHFILGCVRCAAWQGPLNDHMHMYVALSSAQRVA